MEKAMTLAIALARILSLGGPFYHSKRQQHIARQAAISKMAAQGSQRVARFKLVEQSVDS